MNSGLNPASPILVSAFRSALLQQWLIVALIFAAAAHRLGRDAHRDLRFHGRSARCGAVARAAGTAAAAGRFRCHLAVRRDPAGAAADGGRPGRPGDPADRGPVTRLGAAPGELRRDHLGLPPRRRPPRRRCGSRSGSGSGCSSRCAAGPPGSPGWPRSAWGLVVWAFGEAFGGIFAPGLTVLFGAPGAVLIYVVAGALLALPERAWDNPRRLGRSSSAGPARSSSAWRCSRPGRDAASGRARLTGSPARSPP